MNVQEGIDAVEDVETKTERSLSRLRSKLEEAGDELDVFSQTVRRNAEAAWQKTVGYVQEKPGISLGAALLIGAGIGVLLTVWAKQQD